MGTSDVFRVFKIARAVEEGNSRTFKTFLVTINNVFCIYYVHYRQNYSNPIKYFARFTYYIKHFYGFQNAHVSF